MTTIEFAKLENDDISFVFPMNPSTANIVSGQKQVKISIPGRDNDLIQFMGRANKTITINGTLYGGLQFYNKGVRIPQEELIRDMQKIANSPSVFDFAGILVNQAKAEKVTVSGFTIKLDAKKPKSFNYTMILTEYRAFNAPLANMVAISGVDFVDTVREVFEYEGLRRT